MKSSFTLVDWLVIAVLVGGTMKITANVHCKLIFKAKYRSTQANKMMFSNSVLRWKKAKGFNSTSDTALFHVITHRSDVKCSSVVTIFKQKLWA